MKKVKAVILNIDSLNSAALKHFGAASGQMRLTVNSLHNRWGLALSEGVL